MHHCRHSFCAAPDESSLPHLVLAFSLFELSTVVAPVGLAPTRIFQQTILSRPSLLFHHGAIVLLVLVEGYDPSIPILGLRV